MLAFTGLSNLYNSWPLSGVDFDHRNGEKGQGYVFDPMGSKCGKSAAVIKNEPFEPLDSASEVGEVGARPKTSMTNNKELKEVIQQGRREIKEAQDKLNSSLTTPIAESEAKVMNAILNCVAYDVKKAS